MIFKQKPISPDFKRAGMKRKRCIRCRCLSEKWQTVNGSSPQCYDGCYSTTDIDRRTYDGCPAWLPFEDKEAWDPRRMVTGATR